ncbi:MAG TPA: ribonuclease P protein component [Candidatus Hydrogenedentes bacterium]|nr:ribonuclease P protein component [Candidatus Hydrogenedentota bacterium]
MPGKYGFPRQERLTRKREFLAVYENGRKCVGAGLVCYAWRREGQGRKIGFTVSRKVGGATVRNRVKRHLREAVRACRPELPEEVHVVFIARRVASEYDFHECHRAVRDLLRREGMIHG